MHLLSQIWIIVILSEKKRKTFLCLIQNMISNSYFCAKQSNCFFSYEPTEMLIVFHMFNMFNIYIFSVWY